MSLTEKEIRVLELLKQSKSQKDIAEILGVSSPAVTHFKQSALRKIEKARATAKRATDLGFVILIAAFFFSMLPLASAFIPNPGHSAYTVGPGDNGSFYPGNYTFQGNLNITGLTYSAQLCLGGVCQTSWPTSGMWTNSSGNATFTSGNVGIGTTTPSEKLVVENGTVLLSAPSTLRARGNLSNLNPGGFRMIKDVHAVGDYLYIADTWYNWSIVDVTDPDNPRRVVMRDVTGSRSVHAIGTTLYVGTGSGITSYNIQNPVNPVQTGSVSSGSGSIERMTSAGQYLYGVGDDNVNASFTIFDITDRTNPRVISSLELAAPNSDNTQNIDVQGDVAYVATGVSFYLINITNSSNPSILYHYNAFYTSDVIVRGGYAYVGGWGNGFHIFDITNTTNINRTDNYNAAQLISISLAGNYVYGISNLNRTIILDVSDPYDIVEVGRVTLSTPPTSIDIQGRYLYIGTEYVTEIFEIPGIDAPSAQLGSVEAVTATITNQLQVLGATTLHSGLTVGERGIRTAGGASIASNLLVGGTANITSILYTPQLCLNGDCRAAWPTGSSGNLTGSFSAGYMPYAINGSNLGNSNVYFDGTNVGIGDTTPSELFVVGNGDLFRVTSAGIARGPNGAVSGPTFSFTGDTDTGMYSGGADNLRFSTGNAARLTIDSSGRVGIGTTSPSRTLHVANTSSATTLWTGGASSTLLVNEYWDYASGARNIFNGFSSSAASASIGAVVQFETTYTGAFTQSRGILNAVRASHNTGNLTFMIGEEIENLYIGNGTVNNMIGSYITLWNYFDGNITDAKGIDISGIENYAGGTITNGYGIVIRDIDSATNNYGIYVNQTTGYAYYGVGNASSYFGGNVGINTTSPTQLLDVRGNANISSIVYTPQLCLNGDCRTAWPTGDSLWTNSSDNATFTGGNVGIGTTSPSGRLSVNGSFLILNNESRSLLFANETQNTVRIGWYDNTVNVYVNGSVNATGTVNSGAGFDLAEAFVMTEPMGPGDIVAIVDRDSVKKATADEAYLAFGVVSTQPGFTLSKPGLTNTTLIAIAGRVPVKVEGTINRGDYVTVGDTAGFGKAASEPGFVIGRALENSANGEVYVLIQPTYFSPQVTETNRLFGGNAERVFETGLAIANRPSTPASIENRGQDRVLALGSGNDVVVTISN